MPLLSSNGAAILRPEDIQSLVIQPLARASAAMLVSTVVTTGSHATRFPIVQSDASSAWTAEGEEIAVSDPDLDELVVIPRGLKGLCVCSNEMMADSNPAAMTVVGEGLVRDLQVKMDSAFFGDSVSNGPSGLESLSHVAETERSFDGTTDVFAEAISLAENAGALTTNPIDGRPNLTFVGHPNDVLALSTAKTAEDSNLPLLGPDATAATGRSVLGIPILSSPAVGEGAMWLIPRDRTFVVVRSDPSVIADTSAYFSSDRTAIRAVLRVSFGFPHEAAIVRTIVSNAS